MGRARVRVRVRLRVRVKVKVSRVGGRRSDHYFGRGKAFFHRKVLLVLTSMKSGVVVVGVGVQGLGCRDVGCRV
jgi:hypothetical protein